MSEITRDEVEFAIRETGTDLDTEKVVEVIRFITDGRTPLAGGQVEVSSQVREPEGLRDQAMAMATRDSETGTVSSPKGTGNEDSANTKK